jgi:succinate dehydrogenase / fumarate reductase cytochrome b subunit
MLVSGFKNPLVSFFYLLSTGLLCLHLAHGISSLFQTLGLRNRYWKGMLDKLALFYGLIVFIGFASIPVATLSGFLEPSNPSSDDQEVSFAPSNFTFEQLEN